MIASFLKIEWLGENKKTPARLFKRAGAFARFAIEDAYRIGDAEGLVKEFRAKKQNRMLYTNLQSFSIN
jgi:hypothetical protein